VTGFPVQRPRRWRTTAAHRRLIGETTLSPANLVLPLFVGEGTATPVPIPSMPGVLRHSRESLRNEVVRAADAGLGGVMLFGVPTTKDADGSGAWNPEGILNVALRDVGAEVGDDLVVMADLCLDEFTDHGHCGVMGVDGAGRAVVDNDATLLAYGRMAQAQAAAGAHVVGTSGMMDGQVGAVRAALDSAGRTDVAILAYAAKYSSAFYGPFRDAVDSSLGADAGVPSDRATYQQDPANLRESLREVRLDVAEGADAVMVKPAGSYLDVVAAVRGAVDVPVAAYQVSGEMAMVEAAAQRGWIDRDRAVLETLLCIRRAGAEVVLTYWALDAVRLLRADASGQPNPAEAGRIGL
jgi:porphobilinogen synthase